MAEEGVMATVGRVQSALTMAKNEVQAQSQATIIAEEDLSKETGREALRLALSKRRHCVIRRATAMRTHEDHAKFPHATSIHPQRPNEYVGLFSSNASSFLECRFKQDGSIEPSQCTKATVDLGHNLGQLGFEILKALDFEYTELCDLPLPDEFSDRKDELSTTVLRLCHYQATTTPIVFGAHTDTTFLTLVPCAHQPGLEVYDPSQNAFLCHEASPAASPGRDVIVMVGEFLDLFSNGTFASAVHRVFLGSRAQDNINLKTKESVKSTSTSTSSFQLKEDLTIPARSSTPLLLRAKSSRSWSGIPLPSIWSALARAASPDEARRLLHLDYDEEDDKNDNS